MSWYCYNIIYAITMLITTVWPLVVHVSMFVRPLPPFFLLQENPLPKYIMVSRLSSGIYRRIMHNCLTYCVDINDACGAIFSLILSSIKPDIINLLISFSCDTIIQSIMHNTLYKISSSVLRKKYWSSSQVLKPIIL